MNASSNLHRFIVFTAACTLLLIVAGGLVTSTQSGLSVPDWPNTYGHFMFAYPLDQMVGGIFYEHSHRMIASAVGLLTVLMALGVWRYEERRWVRNLAVAAVAAVIAQGVLGGLTVLFLLPTPISVSHATLAQLFFCMIAALALVTSRWWLQSNALMIEDTQRVPLLSLSVFATSAVLIQLVLGAVMRHTQSGLVVPDFPLAYGQFVPSLSPEAIERYSQQLIDRDIRLAADGPITSGQILIHLLHRGWAIVVSTLVLWTSIRLMRSGTVASRLKTLGAMIAVLVLLQSMLGVLTVLSQKAIDITTAHVATGSLLLVACLLSCLHAWKIYGIPRAVRPRITLSAEAVT